MSIEDPFETSYDVAHVVKAPQMMHIHTEFLRAYCLIDRAGIRPVGVVMNNASNLGAGAKPVKGKLPALPKMTDLLSIIVKQIDDDDLPKFVQEARERQEQFKAKNAEGNSAVGSDSGSLTAAKPSPIMQGTLSVIGDSQAIDGVEAPVYSERP